MCDVTLSLSLEHLPVQYGHTVVGSLTGRFYNYASQFVKGSAIDAPHNARWIEVETEYEGVFVSYYDFAPQLIDLDANVSWVGRSQIEDWITVRQCEVGDEQRAVILRTDNGMCFVAVTSEEFMTTLMLSLTP